MANVVAELSMSLDGFVAGANDSPELPLGEGGERLFQWYSSGDTDLRLPGTTMVFKVSRISAIRQAKQVAGDKNVSAGSASIIKQCLKAGLLDEIQINLVPILLGRGVRYFDYLGIEPVALERIRVVEAPEVTHLHFRVLK